MKWRVYNASLLPSDFRWFELRKNEMKKKKKILETKNKIFNKWKKIEIKYIKNSHQTNIFIQKNYDNS